MFTSVFRYLSIHSYRNLLIHSILPLLYFITLPLRSVCCTVDAPSRKRFNSFFRTLTLTNNMTHPLPSNGSIYDYKFDAPKGLWITWQSSVCTYVYNPKLSFAETIVPTKDSICCSFLLSTLILSGKHVLLTGPTGTGKSVNITGHIQNDLPDRFLPISMNFSAQTSASQTQVRTTHAVTSHFYPLTYSHCALHTHTFPPSPPPPPYPPHRT